MVIPGQTSILYPFQVLSLLKRASKTSESILNLKVYFK